MYQQYVILSDLNWNTVRYLQSCEGLYSPHVEDQTASRSWTGPNSSMHHVSNNGVSVTHLNFQLMPYPWFSKQQVSIVIQLVNISY
jgi:hypothetical protein